MLNCLKAEEPIQGDSLLLTIKSLEAPGTHMKLPRDIKILGCCPLRSVSLHGEKVSLALVGHPSSDSVTIKIRYGVDVLLY